jgi:hypothetical protein
LSQHTGRSNYFIDAHLSLENGKFYGNVRDVLGLFGLSTQSEVGYNTKIGFNIKKCELQEIGGGTKHDLLASTADVSTNPQSLLYGENLNAGNRESDNMFTIPPSNIQNPPITTAISVSPATSTTHKTAVLGVCRFVLDANSKAGDLPGYPMSVSIYLAGAVPERFQDDFRQTAWGAEWDYHTKFQILEEPQHGNLESVANRPGRPGDLVYYPYKGYIGMDRVVVEAMNTLPDGSPVYAKLIFFLNVIPIADVPLNGGGQYVYSNTKYCETGKETWTISSAPGGEAGDHSQPQGSFPFGFPSMNVTYGDLPGFAVGEE